MVKDILSKYLVVNVEDDIAVFTTQYKIVLKGFLDQEDMEKLKEAKKRLPAIAGLMRSSHVVTLFRSQDLENNQTSAVLGVKNNAT